MQDRAFVPAIALLRLSCSLQRCQMSADDAGCGPAAWTAEDQRWYAELVVQCTAPKKSRAAIDVPAVLHQVAAMPLKECLHMRGSATMDGRFKDSNHVLWSHDRHGRWFANINGQKVWLGRKLAGLRHGLQHGRGHVASNLKASHNCGHCDCVRWQHNRFQSRSEDVLDREHHQRHGNVLRPELRSLFAPDPQLLTPNQPAQISISRDLI